MILVSFAALGQNRSCVNIMRKILFAFPAIFCAAVAYGTEANSDAVFVFLRPETSSFWNTAMNSTISIPIEYPEGATKATLEVAGPGYSKTYSDLPAGYFELSLPPAVSERTENVYCLTLSFDDGTMRTARLGLVQGVSSGTEGMTRCKPSDSASSWSKVKYRAVLPVPYGMKTVKIAVNGTDFEEKDTGLGGAQGWFALDPVARGDRVSVSGSANGIQYDATLFGWGDGFFFHVR